MLDLRPMGTAGFRARRVRVFGFVGPSLILLLLAGCGSKSERPKEYPGLVTGRVTLDGKPLSGGTITFVPEVAEEEGGRPGLARIEPDGGFWVGSANPAKPAGLIPGRYRVTVLAMRPDPTGTGNPIAQMTVPEVYSEAATSPLEATIVAGKNRLTFDLDSRATLDSVRAQGKRRAPSVPVGN